MESTALGSTALGSPALSPDELKQRARRIVEEVFNQGDLSVANELISPDCVHHVPQGQPALGLTRLKCWLAVARRIFPDFHAVVEDQIAEGDQVVQRITGYGTCSAALTGRPPAGEQVIFGLIEISRAGPDGRFTEHWSSADLSAVLQQFGPAQPGQFGPAQPVPTPANP